MLLDPLVVAISAVCHHPVDVLAEQDVPQFVILERLDLADQSLELLGVIEVHRVARTIVGAWQWVLNDDLLAVCVRHW